MEYRTAEVLAGYSLSMKATRHKANRLDYCCYPRELSRETWRKLFVALHCRGKVEETPLYGCFHFRPHHPIQPNSKFAPCVVIHKAAKTSNDFKTKLGIVEFDLHSSESELQTDR